VREQVVVVVPVVAKRKWELKGDIKKGGKRGEAK
jgi:hypothetical protein